MQEIAIDSMHRGRRVGRAAVQHLRRRVRADRFQRHAQLESGVGGAHHKKVD